MLCASAAPASADTLEIVSPRANALVHGASVVVKVRTGSGIESFHAFVNGREVTGLFTERGGTMRAGIPVSRGLRFGTNEVFVRARRGRSVKTDAVTFVLARGSESESLLGLSDLPDSTGSAIGANAQSAPGTTFRASLNGKSVHDRFKGQGRSLATQLGADDGLRFGRNRLTLRVHTPDGRWDREAQTITVPRDHPLAGAQGPKTARVGNNIRLSGRGSRPTRHGRRLTYLWRVVKAPRGSHPRLEGAQTSKPRLVTRVRGTYKVRLSVGERGRGASASDEDDDSTDALTLDVRDAHPAIGLPVETCAGDDCSLVIGSDPPIRPQSGQPITLVTLNRITAAPTRTVPYADSQAGMAKLKSDIAGLDNNSLVVIFGPSGVKSGNAALDTLDDAAKSIGAKPLDRYLMTGGAHFSIVGVKGWAPGNAHQNVGLALGVFPGRAVSPTGDMYGFLQVNPLSDRYSFVRSDFPSFDTQVGATATSNRIRLRATGSREALDHSADLPADGKAGFHVLVVDDQTLHQRKDGNRAFAVNTSDGKDADNQSAMASMLKQFLDNPGTYESVFFIQTIGRPAVTKPQWQLITDQLKRIGGTETAINDLDGSRGYALVGRPGGTSVESRQFAPTPSGGKPSGRTGALAGVIYRNRQSRLEPVIADPTGQTFNSGLVDVAYQPATAWPERDTPGDKAALAYISEKLSLPGPDPNASYTNRNIDWGTTSSTLGNIPYPDIGHGFSASTFRRVQSQLRQEFDAVATVAKLMTSIKEPLTDASIADLGTMRNMTNELINAASVPRDGTVNGAFTEIFGLGMEFAAGAFPHGVKESQAFEVYEMASILLIIAGIQMETTEHGDPVLDELRVKADNVAATLSNTYVNNANALDLFRDIVVTDYGKLTAAATHAKSDPTWKVDPATTRRALLAGAREFFYARLMPLPYVAWNLGEHSTGDWYCIFGYNPRKPDKHHTFNQTPPSAQLDITTRILDDGRGGIRRERNTLALGRNDTFGGGYENRKSSHPPPGYLTDNLFAPPDPDATDVKRLGVDKLQFFMKYFNRRPPAHGVKYQGTCY